MKNSSEITGDSPGLNDAFRQALDKTALVVITDLEGRITYLNDNFCKLSQYSPEELAGKDHLSLRARRQETGFIKDRWDRVQLGEVWTGQTKNKKKSGSFYWIQSTIVPLLNDTQQPCQYLFFGLDITEQKLAEQKLEENKYSLSAMADNFPDGSVYLFDTELNVLFAGGSENAEFSFRPKEIIGKPLENIVSAFTYQYIKKHLPRILNGETITHQIQIESRHYSHTYKPVYDDQGVLYGFIMVVNNISEARGNILALKRMNEMFEIGEELAGIGSWESFSDAMEIYFSSNTLKLLGRDASRNRWSFNEILTWIHPEDIETVFKSFQGMVDENLPGIQEFRILKPDGEERLFQSFSKMDLDEKGAELRKFGVVIDITEKKEKELELVRSREILRNIADSIPGLVMRYVEFENKKPDIQYVSKGAEILWEIPYEEIFSDVDIAWKRVHADDLPCFLDSFRQARETVSVWEREFRIVMSDGRIKWVAAIGTPKEIPGHKILWDILALDVTARKIAEENIEKNLELLTYQNVQLRDFCNIVSHNLRSPLVNTSMLIDFIEESVDEKERRIYIDKLKPVIEGLNETFQELVDSIQIQQDHEVEFEMVGIKACFKKTISGFEGQVSLSKAIVEADFSEAPLVYCPPKYFSSILHNLISNSLKYRSPDRQLKISIKTTRTKNGILLSVQDNGLGIDMKKHRHNLFKIKKVFHRHPDAKGFGLYITKAQVEAIKGKIWAESNLNKGTTFYVEFLNHAGV